MSTVNLQLNDESLCFAPGETLSGEANWVIDAHPSVVEINLLWYTSGKGNPDTVKRFTQRIEQPAKEGRQPFSFILPPGPCSFSGILVKLTWAIEAIVLPEKTCVRRDIVLAPGKQEIVMD